MLLNVLGKRADGFHELETLLHPVPVFDRIEFHQAGNGIALDCNDPSIPADATNLVWRAAQAFLARAGIRDGVRIRLEKQIPAAAGLGGGSGNAATTLLALNDLFGAPLPPGVLTELAASLGSDVPFFLQDRPALATGRGEQITPLDPFPSLRNVWILLIHPGFGVSTPWAYQKLENFPGALSGRPGRAAELAALLGKGSLQDAAPGFCNSLELPVLYKFPLLALIQEFLREQGALVALMSGSGSSTFALAESQARAEQLRESFLARFGPAFWTAIAHLGEDLPPYSKS